MAVPVERLYALPPQDLEKLPILKAEEIRAKLIAKIVLAKKTVVGREGLLGYLGLAVQLVDPMPQDLYINLIELSSRYKDGNSPVTDPPSYVSSYESGPTVGRAQNEALQDAVLDVMTEYGGMDVQKHYGWNDDGITTLDNGASREILVFPSKILGLSFMRKRDFLPGIEGADRNISLSWDVVCHQSIGTRFKHLTYKGK